MILFFKANLIYRNLEFFLKSTENIWDNQKVKSDTLKNFGIRYFDLFIWVASLLDNIFNLNVIDPYFKTILSHFHTKTEMQSWKGINQKCFTKWNGWSAD